MAFSPGSTVDGDSLERRLAESDCVVVCQSASYEGRVWCQREALLAKKVDVPLIVARCPITSQSVPTWTPA